jgi:hypothetical protein
LRFEILCNPIPERLERSVPKWATALHVHERSLLYARELARGELTKAVHDFYRLNWIGDLDQRSPEFGLRWMKLGDFQEQNTFGHLLRVVWLGALAGNLLA